MTKERPRPHNLREDQVFAALDDLLAARKNVCGCASCHAGLSVFALNRLEPAYVATGLGETLTRLHGQEDQSRAHVAAKVALAIKKIGKKPGHD